MVELKITRLDKDMDEIKYAYEHDAAFDLRAAHDETFAPGEKKIVKSGVKMAIPAGYVGLIWDRSGMAAKHTMHTLAGVIDSGYRGEVGIVMINLSDKEFKVEKNMRIAQMLIQPVAQPKVIEVEEEELEKTERGEGGFGSSGTQ